MPNFKRIGGGPWKNVQKSDDLTWNDPFVIPAGQLLLNWMIESLLDNTLFLSINCSSLLLYNFSSILENWDNRDIGL